MASNWERGQNIVRQGSVSRLLQHEVLEEDKTQNKADREAKVREGQGGGWRME